MVTFWLDTELQHPIPVTTPSKGFRVLGVPFGTLIYTSSFIKDAMLKNVQHVDLFFRMGDVQITFGI
jgi:hypothetical protein